jgi:hypothetical protein
MTDLDARFREAQRIRVPNLWPDIIERQPAHVPPDRGWRRPVAIATTLAVAAAAVGFAGWALLRTESRPQPPATPVCSEGMLDVPYPAVPSSAPRPSYEQIAHVTAISSNDAWAVGRSSYPSHAGYQPASARILHWDGTAWRRVQAPVIAARAYIVTQSHLVRGRYGTLLSVSAAGPDDVWAVGYESGTLIEHWNGRAWSRVLSPHPGPSFPNAALEAVDAMSPTDVWMVGRVGRHPLVVHWDGDTWSGGAPGVKSATSRSRLTAVEAIAPDDVWATGTSFDPETRGDRALAMHWDGKSWREVSMAPVPSAGTVQINALGAAAPNDVWAVGYWSRWTTRGAPIYALVEHWDGTAWSVVPVPHSSDDYRLLTGVAVAAPNDVWAVGWKTEIETPGVPRLPLVQRWDGSRWSDVVDGIPGSGFNAVSALPSGELWAVGEGDQSSGQRAVFAHRSC